MELTYVRLSTVVAFLFGWLCLVSGDLSTVPSNTAALAGSTVTLSCAAVDLPTSTRVLWREYATNVGGLTISDGKQLNPTHPNVGRYSITGSELDYHLEIRDVRASDAGLYFCEDINGPPNLSRGYAELIVLESDPLCDDFVPVSGVVVEGEQYNAECEMKFQGNMRPVMTWTGPGQFTGNSSNPATSVWANVRFVAHRDIEDGQFSCRTNFNPLTTAPPQYATNAPDYVHVYTGPPIVVVWGPNNLQLIPILGEYAEGDIITCHADCKPDCTYKWTNLRTLQERTGETYIITPDHVGFEQTLRCESRLDLMGFIRTADAFLDCNVPAITTPTTPSTIPPSTPPPADAPCTDVTGRWASSNPDAIVCLEVDSKGNLLTLIRNGSDPFFVTGNGKTVYNDYKHIGFTGVWPLQGAVGGFTGECHRCHGVEAIQLSGLFRNKRNSDQCGVSAGTQLTRLYTLTRSGPPCRGETLEVYDTKPGQLELMGIKAKGEIFKPLNK